MKAGGRWADAVVGLLGGVMAPLSGFSGLAPALWATLRGYSKDEHRAVLQNFNLVVLAATMASLVRRLTRATAMACPAVSDIVTDFDAGRDFACVGGPALLDSASVRSPLTKEQSR